MKTHPDIISITLNPGWVKTDLGGPYAPLEPRDSVAGQLKVFLRLKKADAGKFLSFDGQELTWQHMNARFLNDCKLFETPMFTVSMLSRRLCSVTRAMLRLSAHKSAYALGSRALNVYCTVMATKRESEWRSY